MYHYARSYGLTEFPKCYIISNEIKVLMPILLARFRVISSDTLSLFVSFINIIVTIHNTFNGFNNGGVLMITVLEMVGMGTCGVTKQAGNNFGFVVSDEA